MTWKKRIISIVLCLCALLCAASVRAEAADAATTHTDHLVCGGTTCDHKTGTHITNTPTWTAWNGGDITYDTNGIAYIYLSDDVTLQINNDFGKPKFLDVGSGKTLYLCLNGHSLTNRGSHTISVDGTLVLCDCKGSGKISHTTKEGGGFSGSDGIYVGSGAAFTMYGGTISSNNEGVQVFKGTFTMYGGKISNNDGRGVLVSGGTFTMYGGEISHNKCITTGAEGGGGVWVKNNGSSIGNFAMYGGKISNNTYKGTGNCGGGGVYASGTGDFIIQGGEITNNQCSYKATDTSATTSGGGLYISGKPRELKIENCTISNNTCDGEGGGIFINCANVIGTITGCTISGNEAGGKGGGFASQYCTLTIGNCNITNNRTAGKGGAMAVGSWGEDSKITLSGSMNFSGNAQGCTAGEDGKLTGDTANDVHLNTRSVYLRLADDFSKTSAPIVVTTASEPNAYGCKKIAEDNRTTLNPGDFKYGNDDTIGIIAKTKADGTTVELLACKHSYSTQKDETNHWQECSICKDIKGVTAHSGGEASCTKKAVCRVCNQPYGGLAAHDYDMTTWVKIDNDHHGHKCKNCNAVDESTKAPHSWDNVEVTTPATCTADGERTYTCAVCSATKTKTIPATGHAWDTKWSKDNDHHWHKCKNANCTEIADQAEHSWDEGTVTTPATCTTPGVKTLTCTVCSATKTKTIPASGHTWGTDWVKDDSDKDHHWHECTKCHEKKDLTEHDWGSGTVTTPATCTTPGVKTFSCGTCSATKTETIGASGHTWGTDWVKDDSDKAHHWHECTKCHEKKDLTEHDWNEGAVTTPATCTTPGEKTYTCMVCSATKTETIDASGHDLVHHEAKAVTCTAAGWDAYDTCSRCDYTTYVEKSASGHDLVHHEAKAATCTAVGWDAYDTCTRCDYTTYVEEAASGHDLVHHEAKAATCTAVGWDAYDTCRRCDYTTYVEKSTLGHDFTVPKYDEIQHWYKCANCTATTEPVAHTDVTAWKSDRSGHWNECSTCGYKTAVNAHTPDRDKATETTPQLCTVCGYVIAPATHPVHTWVFVAETPATCNAAGEREHYKCTCGQTSFKNGADYYINEDASVLTIEKNSANHTGAPGSEWLSDSENHWQEYTCCHARANEAAHSGGAATCTAQAVCQVCGKAYGPLAAHDWGAWKVTTPATKDAPGVETRTCTHNSAHTETRSIPKLSTAVYTVSEDTKIAQIEAKVDGLDKILESDENKALVNDGKSVGVSLTVKNTASSGVSEKIKEKLAGSNLVGLRLELTVEKTVTANGVVESKQTIPDAGVLLKTTITLPAELQGKSGYVVYRLHDGNVHVLTETANENGEFISVSADKTQITICARLYSEYVIAYQAGGSSGGGYHPVNATPVKATSANTGDAGVLLYGVTAALSLTGTAWLGAKSRKH